MFKVSETAKRACYAEVAVRRAQRREFVRNEMRRKISEKLEKADTEGAQFWADYLKELEAE